jgi:hypothetical protein
MAAAIAAQKQLSAWIDFEVERSTKNCFQEQTMETSFGSTINTQWRR